MIYVHTLKLTLRYMFVVEMIEKFFFYDERNKDKCAQIMAIQDNNCLTFLSPPFFSLSIQAKQIFIVLSFEISLIRFQ